MAEVVLVKSSAEKVCPFAKKNFFSGNVKLYACRDTVSIVRDVVHC